MSHTIPAPAHHVHKSQGSPRWPRGRGYCHPSLGCSSGSWGEQRGASGACPPLAHEAESLGLGAINSSHRAELLPAPVRLRVSQPALAGAGIRRGSRAGPVQAGHAGDQGRQAGSWSGRQRGCCLAAPVCLAAHADVSLAAPSNPERQDNAIFIHTWRNRGSARLWAGLGRSDPDQKSPSDCPQGCLHLWLRVP